MISQNAKCGDDMDLASRIKQLREGAGLTQLELAKILQVSNSTLSQYESGARVPSDEMKAAIADYFRVSLDYLYGRTNQKQPSSTIPKENLQAAFWGGEKDLSQEDLDDMWNDVERFAAFLVEKKKQEKKEDG